ncbi:MAG: PaaI family thioesterase [Pseudomonadota bacterium]
MKQEEILIASLQKFMGASPFIKALKIELVEVDPSNEALVMRMPMQDLVERGAGSKQMHGGAVASLIDTAGCFSLIMGRVSPVPTINFRVDYLRPVSKTDAIAHAFVRRAGKAVGVVDVDVKSEEGALLAVGRGSFGL